MITKNGFPRQGLDRYLSLHSAFIDIGLEGFPHLAAFLGKTFILDSLLRDVFIFPTRLDVNRKILALSRAQGCLILVIGRRSKLRSSFSPFLIYIHWTRDILRQGSLFPELYWLQLTMKYLVRCSAHGEIWDFSVISEDRLMTALMIFHLYLGATCILMLWWYFTYILG